MWLVSVTRSSRDDDPVISREQVPDALLPWVTPKSSLKVTRTALDRYGYELKVFVDTAEEALDPDVLLAQIEQFDRAFKRKFAKGNGPT